MDKKRVRKTPRAKIRIGEIIEKDLIPTLEKSNLPKKKNRGCLINGCLKKHSGRGYCGKHYTRLIKTGNPLGIVSRRKHKPGERKYAHDYHGYVRIWMPDHSNSNKRGYMKEHTYVISQHIGRPLFKHETIHHKNGIRNDNRLENLELWSHGQPYGQRVEDKIKFYIEFLKEYGYEITKSQSS